MAACFEASITVCNNSFFVEIIKCRKLNCLEQKGFESKLQLLSKLIQFLESNFWYYNW
jgi:hypothetical protein